MKGDNPFAIGAELEPTGPQSEAINCALGDVVVTAGPGSGKTRVLVGRIEKLLEDGVPPEHVVGITFTNRAAAEIKERLRTNLSRRWMAARSEGDLQSALNWRSLIWRIDSAYLGTIHGFCQSILADYPQLAGVDPNFAVIDSYRRSMAMEDIGRRVVDEALALWDLEYLPALVDERGHAGPKSHLDFVKKMWDAAMRFALSWSEIESITEESIRQRFFRLGGTEEIWKSGGLDSRGVATLESSVDRLLELHRSGAAPTAKKYPPLVEAFIPRWEQLRCDLRGEEAEEALESIRRYLPNDSVPKDYKESIEAIHGVGAPGDLRREFAAAKEILAILKEIGARYREFKDSRGLLDFDDMQRLVLEGLRREGELLRRLRRRYTHILVDEFQDTDEVQWGIVSLLRGDGPTRPAREGGVFVVGDADQSIYRFRGADVEIFRSAGRKLEEFGAHRVHLNTNFRSVPGLVERANAVFSTQFADYLALASDPAAEISTEIPVEFLVLARPGRKKVIADFRRRQAEVIVDRVQAYLDAGKSPEEIAILGRGMNSLQPCARALASRGLPYKVAGGRGFFDSEEISDVRALLHWIADAEDDISLAALLRSPFFSLDDETILDLSRESGKSLWSALRARVDENDSRASRCAATLSTWREWMAVLSPGDLMATILDTTFYRESISSHPWSGETLENLERVIAVAHRMNRDEGTGVAELARRFDMLATAGMDDDASGGAEVDEEVLISTVHRAKGLEFDTVIIPDACSSNSWKAPDFVLRKGMGLAMRLPDRKGPFFSDLSEEDKTLDAEEEKRIFYVACTRAERELILVGGGKEEPPNLEEGILDPGYFSKGSYFLAYSTGLRETEDGRVRLTHVPLEDLENRGGSGSSAGYHREGVRDLIDRFERITGSRRPDGVSPGQPVGARTYSVTSLMDYDRCPRLYLLRHRLGWPELSSRGGESIAGSPGELPVDPMTFGTLVHRACELLVGREAEAAVDAALAEAGLSPEIGRIAPVKNRMLELVGSFSRSDSFRAFSDAYARGLAESEWSFLHPVPGMRERYLSGKIDGIFRGDSTDWIVIDYKSDRVGADDVPERAVSYEFQMRLYRWVVIATLGDVEETGLYFLHPGTWYRLPGEESPGSMIDRVKGMIEHIETSDDEGRFPAAPGEHCAWCGFEYHCSNLR